MDYIVSELSDAEVERLTLLMEECAEVQQIIGKVLRFGYESINPLVPEEGTNRDRLERELGDLSLIITMMGDNEDIKYKNLQDRAAQKRKKIQKFLRHNEVKSE